MSYYGVDYPNYYLAHYRTKGATNKRHKYVAIKNGQYIYDTPADRRARRLNYADSTKAKTEPSNSEEFERIVKYRGVNNKIDPKAYGLKKSPIGIHGTNHDIHGDDRRIHNLNPSVMRMRSEHLSRRKHENSDNDKLLAKQRRNMNNGGGYHGPQGKESAYRDYSDRENKAAEANRRRDYAKKEGDRAAIIERRENAFRTAAARSVVKPSQRALNNARRTVNAGSMMKNKPMNHVTSTKPLIQKVVNGKRDYKDGNNRRVVPTVEDIAKRKEYDRLHGHESEMSSLTRRSNSPTPSRRTNEIVDRKRESRKDKMPRRRRRFTDGW